MKKAHSTNGYRHDIDGIRAIAVLAVIIYHLNPQWLPGGFLGVDIFFVVSGYLISGIILRKNYTHSFSFKNFYARRIKRIFPALFMVLFLSAGIGTFLLHPQTYINFIKSSRYASAQLANFFFAREVGYFDEGFSEQPLLHLWTLGVEEQFYLFWPLLLVFLFWLCNRKKIANISRHIAIYFIGITIFSFSACYILAQSNHNIAFYMFYTRAWEFCIGGIIALGVFPSLPSKIASNTVSLLGLLLLCFSFIAINDTFLNISFLQFGILFPCLGTVFLLYTNEQDGLVSRLLSTRIPVFTGKISYSLYLYHWPIIIFTKNFDMGAELNLTKSFLIVIASFILATGSYYLIEQPARRSKIPDNYIILIATITMIMFATGFKILQSYDTAPWRIQKYTSGKRGQYPATPKECKTQYGSQKYKECKTMKEADAPYIALVGDSHSIHYLNSVVALAKISGHNVLFLSAAGCPMLLGDIRFASTASADHEQSCKDALSFFESEIVNNDKVKHIFLAQRFDLLHNGKGFLAPPNLRYSFKDLNGSIITEHTDYYREQLINTINTIRKKGQGLTILKQIPLFPGSKDCEWEPHLKKWLTPENICSYNTGFIQKWQQPSIDFIDNIIQTTQISSFDPMPYLEKPRKNNRNLYENVDHLNGNGCYYVVPGFLQEMHDNSILKNSDI